MNHKLVSLVFLGLACFYTVGFRASPRAMAGEVIHSINDNKQDQTGLNLIEQWRSDFPMAGIRWSSDSSALFAYGYQLALLDRSGHLQTKSMLPILYTYHLIIDPRHVVMVGDNRTNIAFSIIDIASGKTVFEGHLPPQTDPGAQAAIHFALSQDGLILATAYNVLSQGHTIWLYDTKDWNIRSTIDLPIEKTGVNRIAFSPDGSLLAFSTEHAVSVTETHTGGLVRSIGVDGNFFAISPDNKVIAVEEVQDAGGMIKRKDIKIFRLSDGQKITVHAPDHTNCSMDDDNCGVPSSILWNATGDNLIFFRRCSVTYLEAI